MATSPRAARPNFPKPGRKALHQRDINKLDSAWFYKPSLVNPTHWHARNILADALKLDRMAVHRFFTRRYQVRDLRNHFFSEGYKPQKLPLKALPDVPTQKRIEIQQKMK